MSETSPPSSVPEVIDVLPEDHPEAEMRGYQLMIAGDVLRGRYRTSLDKPEPIAPNAILKYQIGFPGNDHVFGKGHRVMVQVQSTWFPVIDLNPQRFVPNIFQATASDFQRATQRVYRSRQHASHLSLPVVQ